MRELDTNQAYATPSRRWGPPRVRAPERGSQSCSAAALELTRLCAHLSQNVRAQSRRTSGPIAGYGPRRAKRQAPSFAVNCTGFGAVRVPERTGDNTRFPGSQVPQFAGYARQLSPFSAGIGACGRGRVDRARTI